MPIWIDYEIEGKKNSFVVPHTNVTLHKVEYPDGEVVYEFTLPDLGGTIQISKGEYENVESQLENVLHLKEK